MVTATQVDSQLAWKAVRSKSITPVVVVRNSSSRHRPQFPTKTVLKPAPTYTIKKKVVCKSRSETNGPSTSICRTVTMPAYSSSRTLLIQAQPIQRPTHLLNNQEY